MSGRWSRRRRAPYTALGIRRVPCVRCGEPAAHQWHICSDGNRPRAICLACDVALNALVLRWMRHPEAEALIKRYRREARA